jgi:hypothetical protein
MKTAFLTIMQNTICVGLSLPKEILKKIDKERQDISRSKYVLRIIEKLYLQDDKENNNCCYDSLDSSSPKPVTSESFEVSK